MSDKIPNEMEKINFDGTKTKASKSQIGRFIIHNKHTFSVVHLQFFHIDRYKRPNAPQHRCAGQHRSGQITPGYGR